MLHKSKTKWIIAIGLVLLLILTNPSLSTFKEYRGKDPKRNYQYVRRDLNFFVLSVYVDNTNDNEKYIGVLGNFIDVSKRIEQPTAADSTRVVDSTVRAIVAADSASKVPPLPSGVVIKR